MRKLALYIVISSVLGLLCAVAAQETAEAPADAAPPKRAAPPGDDGRTSTLQGSAYLDRRRKVVGASVVVCPEDDSSRIYLTTTDAKGRFRLDRIPDGSYRVEIRRDGLAPVTKSNVPLKYPFRAVVEVAMQPLTGATRPAAEPANGSLAETAGVRGTIVGADGQPVSEVGVRLVRSDATTDPRDARSDADGGFDFAGLPAGEWAVSVLGLGYLPIRATLPFERNSELVVVVIQQPASYEPAAVDLLPPERPIPPVDLMWQPREPALADAAEGTFPDAAEEETTGEEGEALAAEEAAAEDATAEETDRDPTG